MEETATVNPGISIGDLITGAWKIFTENFLTIVIITLIVQIPLAFAVQGISHAQILSDQQDYLNQQSDLIRNNQADEVDIPAYMRATAELAGLALAIHFFGTLVSTLSFMAIVLVAKSAKEGVKLDYRAALAQALPRWPAAIVTLLMIQIMLSVLFAFFIAPGVVFYIYWSFAIQAVIIHRKFGWSAVSDSMDLVNNRWWKVLGYSLVLGLMAIAVTIVINTLNIRQGVFFADIGFAVVTSIALAFFAVAYTLFFIDLDKTRKSGLKPAGIVDVIDAPGEAEPVANAGVDKEEE